MSEHSWVKYYKGCSAEDLSHLKPFGECGSGAPPPPPHPGPYRVPSVSLSSSSPPFLSVHCQLNKSICLRRTIWNEPTVSYNTQRRETDGAGRWASGLADWEFGLSDTPTTPRPPVVLKITSASSDCPDRLGLGGTIIFAMFVQQREKTRTFLVYMQRNSRNSEIIS